MLESRLIDSNSNDVYATDVALLISLGHSIDDIPQYPNEQNIIDGNPFAIS